jgi:N-formylglutamate deformylase
MSDAVRQHEPGGQPIPLVLDSPHSGTAYPDDFDHLPPRDVVRQAEDTHVEALYAAAPSIGATLIEALFPRAYIDPNRHRSDIDPKLLADAWAEPIKPSRKTELGIGLVWRLAHGGVPMYARKLSAAEVRRRITDFYDPYHASVSAALDRRHAAFGAVWHINCHSMPAVGDVMSEDPGRARADFVLGDRDGSTCAPEFTAFVAKTLTGLGYECRDQRSLQGRGAGAYARPSGRAAPQPANRNQSQAVHGRIDTRQALRIRDLAIESSAAAAVAATICHRSNLNSRAEPGPRSHQIPFAAHAPPASPGM